MRSFLPVLSALLLAGCPDPEKQYPDGTVPQGTAPTGEGTVAPMGDGTAPAAPPPGGAATGDAPTVPTLSVEPGTGVKVSGNFTYDGTTKGNYRLDVFRVGPDGRPMILHAGTFEKTGPFELEFPKDLGSVHMMAFVDANGNGPEVAEPSMLLSDVVIADKPVTGLELKPVDGAKNEYAVDNPNLPPPGSAPTGGAAPGGAPAGAPPAPEGGAPPAAPASPTDGAAAAPAAPAGAPATAPTTP